MKPAFGLLFFSCLIIFGCTTTPTTTQTEDLSIAFMPDIHFHDIYGDFVDQAFVGLPTDTPDGKKLATIRSMSAQLNSTRLFNENYFALLAALDDIVEKKIKYVALPGDFSDDGQPLHIRGLKKILDYYHQEHGLEFFSAPGNHDPTRPFSHPAGKWDYLGEQGKEQPVFSHQHPACTSQTQKPDAHPVICSDDVMEWGYEPIMSLLGEHGFYPKPDYVYFETPYSDYAYGDYDYATAHRQAGFALRQYEICHQGTGGRYKQQGYTDCYSVPDSSYLVEPTPGIWLLAIDANVYQPKSNSSGDAQDAENYLGSGNAGYNKVVTHKAHLLNWINQVVQRAHVQQKTLIAFSHFPMHEFYDGASDDIAKLVGDRQFQLDRKPSLHTSKILAETGLKLHVAGHMHINDTGIYRDEDKVLFNIQAPSLAAYVPAYKVLTIKQQHQIEVHTVILKTVPRFNELFEHYYAEWKHLHDVNAPHIWDREILQSDSYQAFTEWHLRELVRLRFLPQEWPSDVRDLLLTLDGKDILILSQLNIDIGLEQIKLLRLGKSQNKALQKAWHSAAEKANQVARQYSWKLESFTSWTGQDVGLDLYRLRNADQLALKHISALRLQQYRVISDQLATNADPGINKPGDDIGWVTYREKLAALFTILQQFSVTQPSDHFLLDLDKGQIIDLTDNTPSAK